MVHNINLIPQEEVQQQTKTTVVRISTVFMILLLVVALGISGYLFYTVSNIKNNIVSLDTVNEDLRTQIRVLNQFEIVARNLDKKYVVLESLFSDRQHYSLLLQEIMARKPGPVTLNTFDVRGTSINVSGRSQNYIAIANFVNQLLDKEFAGGNEDLKSLFTSVSLNSVTLEQSEDNVNFFLVINYDASKLKKL